jgi:hypothetical protein
VETPDASEGAIGELQRLLAVDRGRAGRLFR